jgi:hypothetical protein
MRELVDHMCDSVVNYSDVLSYPKRILGDYFEANKRHILQNSKQQFNHCTNRTDRSLVAISTVHPAV